jgi:hypothetical protein
MRRWAFVFLGAALLVPGVALADGNSRECRELIARVVKITGASFDRLTPSGVNVILRHPLSEEMVLSCPNHAISVSWDKNAYPDNAWFAFAAKAGFAVTGVEPKRIEAAIAGHGQKPSGGRRPRFSGLAVEQEDFSAAVGGGTCSQSMWMVTPHFPAARQT